MARPNWEYIRIDVLLMENHKVEELSDRAFRALIDLWCYCGRNHTDGAVTDRRWKAVPPKARKELLTAGLADQDDGGAVTMHDYLAHQRSKDTIEDVSGRRAEAGRRGAEARWRRDGKPYGKPHGSPHPSADGKTMAEAEAEAEEEDPPARSAPPPKGPRATRLPEDFAITTDLVAWASENVPGFDYLTETMRFRGYWKSAARAKARKADWKATWRNWMRRAYDDAAARNPPAANHRQSRQQETDDLFGAAMQRAKAREEFGNDPHRDGNAGTFRQGALPPAADRLLHARRLARSPRPPRAGRLPQRRRGMRQAQARRRTRRDY